MLVIPIVIVIGIHVFHLIYFKKYSWLMLPIFANAASRADLTERWIRRESRKFLIYFFLDVVNMLMLTVLFFFGNRQIRYVSLAVLFLSGSFVFLANRVRSYIRVLLFVYLLSVVGLFVILLLQYIHFI